MSNLLNYFIQVDDETNKKSSSKFHTNPNNNKKIKIYIYKYLEIFFKSDLKISPLKGFI